MSDKLYNAMQQSFVDGYQVTLAAMNEADFFLVDTYTREKIEYGHPFYLFRGRVFASIKNWREWVLEQSALQREGVLLDVEPERYTELWKKYRKTRVKTLTNNEE